MPHRDAAQRVRDRILDWLKREGRGSKTRLAAAVSAKYGAEKSPSWVTSIQRLPDDKGQDVRLKDLDAIADCLDVQPGELVSRYDRKYLEVTMAEARLIEYYRMLPDPMRAHWMYLLDYVFRPYREAASAAAGAKPSPRRPPRRTRQKRSA